MKKYQSLIIVLVFCVLTASKCKKDPLSNPIDQLPAATQTGANTFGCLVNGVAFLPGGNSLGGGNLHCNYQFFNNGYFVVIGGTNNGTNLRSISIFTDSLKIAEGQNYVLKTRIKGDASGMYFFGYTTSTGAQVLNQYFTNTSGLLNLAHLDTINQIMSGTFWFNAFDSNGDSAKITDGRFDMHYTR